MALRVLLADESATIKKVMQISLQDFAVEVRAVQMGVDVLQVAQQFKPDIIFVDILLQKKNGYEVSQELKKDPLTRAIPVVLMWSGFMEVDVAKLKASMADSQLEKPFDADGLRSLIQKFVPKTQSQRLAQHLEFPDVPKAESTQTKTVTKTQIRNDLDLDLERESPAAVITESAKSAKAAPPPEKTKEDSESSWSMDSFEDLGDFGGQGESSVEEITETKPGKTQSGENETSLDLSPYSEEEDNWVQKDLSSFKVDLPDGDDEPIALDFDVPEEDIDDIINTQTKPMARKQTPPAKADPRPQPVAQASGPTPEQIEKIVREQSRDIIEKVVKKLVPDIASQLIKEEIRRLLDESP